MAQDKLTIGVCFQVVDRGIEFANGVNNLKVKAG